MDSDFVRVYSFDFNFRGLFLGANSTLKLSRFINGVLFLLLVYSSPNNYNKRIVSFWEIIIRYISNNFPITNLILKSRFLVRNVKKCDMTGNFNLTELLSHTSRQMYFTCELDSFAY